MKNLAYIAGEISKGKNLSENIVKYANGMSTMYNGLGFIKMSMNYYTVLDMVGECVYDESLKININKLNDYVEKYIVGDGDSCEGYTKFFDIREELTHIMEIITAYVDRFRIYEHVLNRIEYRFADENPDMDYYNSSMTNDIMHYILSDKDNVVINSKISEIVGQLPIRMLKDVFYEHIRDAFTLYHGSSKQSVDDFYYALSTSAMLSSEDDFGMFSEISLIYDTLRNADYSNIDVKEYERLKGALDIATEKITTLADIYVLFVQVVNDALTIILSKDSTLLGIEEVVIAKNMIKNICNSYKNDSSFEDELAGFEAFEGKQEKILEIISTSDFAVDYVNANYSDKLDELEMKKSYDSLSKIVKLQSGSDFVNLKTEIFSDIPDNSYADETAERLISELDEGFKKMSLIVKRAVMATVLSGLPVFFNNTTELQNYINNALIQCNDKAEQLAVIEIIRDLIRG